MLHKQVSAFEEKAISVATVKESPAVSKPFFQREARGRWHIATLKKKVREEKGEHEITRTVAASDLATSPLLRSHYPIRR